MMAVNTPAMAGYPLAREIPRQSGRAIRKTRKPESRSLPKYLVKPDRLPHGASSPDSLILVEVAEFMTGGTHVGDNEGASHHEKREACESTEGYALLAA